MGEAGGDAVDKALGASVGEVVGEAVDTAVGAAAGEAVGKAVGAVVGRCGVRVCVSVLNPGKIVARGRSRFAQ